MAVKLLDRIRSIARRRGKRGPRNSEVARQLNVWNSFGGEYYNPDDIGLATYKEMYRSDATIRASINLIKLAVLSRNWHITPSDSEQSQFLSYVFSHMNGRLSGALGEIFTAIPYGFSVSEIVYEYIEMGRWDGLVGVKRLKGLDPEGITFKVDKFGNLVEIKQDSGLEKGISIPKDRVIIYSNEPEFGNIYGTSRLRAIYTNWFVKQQILKYWNIYLERFAIPILVGKVQAAEDLDEMVSILDNIQAKTSIATVEGWNIGKLEAGIGQSSVNANFENNIDYQNTEIVKNLMVPSLLMSAKKYGSYASSRTHFDLFRIMINNLETDLDSIIEQHLIKPLVDLNFGVTETYPQFRFDPLTREDLAILSEALLKLQKAGIIHEDEAFIRDLLGLPPMDKEILKAKQDREAEIAKRVKEEVVKRAKSARKLGGKEA